MEGQAMDDLKKRELAQAALKTAVGFSASAWIAFILLDAFAEFFMNQSSVFDAGIISIPVITLIAYIAYEFVNEQIEGIRYKARYNILLLLFFLGANVVMFIITMLAMEADIWLIPQESHGFLDFNGIEYILFPMFFAAIMTVGTAISKTVIYFILKFANKNKSETNDKEK